MLASAGANDIIALLLSDRGTINGCAEYFSEWRLNIITWTSV